MKFEQFIAKKFLPKNRAQYSGPLVSIATYSIALGVLVMVMAVCILRGFQSEIRNKVVGFGSHIVVKSYQIGNAYEETPISTTRPDVERLRQVQGVKHIQFFANKGGMIKTDDQIHGIIFKGVDKEFDSTFFIQNLTQGRLFHFSDSTASTEVVISSTIANKLKLSLGDKVRAYFWSGDTYRARAFTVVGIYNTDLTEFDEHYIVGDLRQIQKMNGWSPKQVAGIEILVDNFNKLDHINNQLLTVLDYDLTSNTIVAAYPPLFSWLDLLNSNIVLIITIMALVCIVAVISALMIMIFEKTSTIGLLKSMGANNTSIRKIFLLRASQIIIKGILMGELLAVIFCWLQSRYHIVKLDSESYSMSYVPIQMNTWTFIATFLGTLIVCITALLLPANHIAKIEPAKTIKVE